MKWQQNNTITHSATASPSTSARRATHPRSHPLDPAPLPSFPLSLTLSRHPGHAGIPWRGKRGGKKKKKDEEEERTGWLTDSLQVYSEIRKEQRVPVFILLTGTIIRPFLRPFLFPSTRFFYLFFSRPLPSRAELRYRPAALKPYG